MKLVDFEIWEECRLAGLQVYYCQERRSVLVRTYGLAEAETYMAILKRLQSKYLPNSK